jgi:hypothetical protein
MGRQAPLSDPIDAIEILPDAETARALARYDDRVRYEPNVRYKLWAVTGEAPFI